MKFAVALFAVTLLAQTINPTFAQTVSGTDLANAPIGGETTVNALGGAESAARLKPKMQFSDEQKEKFFEMKNKMLSEIGPKKVELSEQQRRLRDLLTQETLDRNAIQGAQDKINALRTDLANVHLAYRMDMQQQLTSEQRKSIRYHGLKSGKNHGKRHGSKIRRHAPRTSNEVTSPTSAAPDTVTSASL